MATRSKPDHYAKRARREGYGARSVYKLEEIQRRFGVLKRGDRVLDIGAAPGSWSQLAARIAGENGMIVAVDLAPMDALEQIGVITTVTGDVFSPEILGVLESYGPFDAIISDAAPRTTGNRSVDTARSAALVERAISLCYSLLVPRGNLVAKVFQGGEEQRLLTELKTRFGSARMVKPQASRSESFETFLVAIGFTGHSNRSGD